MVDLKNSYRSTTISKKSLVRRARCKQNSAIDQADCQNDNLAQKGCKRLRPIEKIKYFKPYVF